jgi:hypothetical protein
MNNEGILGKGIVMHLGDDDGAISENGDSTRTVSGDESGCGETSGLSSIPGIFPLNMGQ